MRIAYLDCFSGISGDMFLGALLDAGLPFGDLKEAMASLPVSGYRLEMRSEGRMGIAGTRFVVNMTGEGHAHRRLEDIRRMISSSGLSDGVKSTGTQVFETLARAEAKVHGTSPEDVTFHEVGAVDSIVDILGGVYGVERLGIEALHVSSLPLGTGSVRTAHGNLPLPAPATLELVAGLPVKDAGVEFETVTPTGAVLIKVLGRSFGPMPPMRVERVGYGVGSRDLADRPNLLRILVGEAAAGRETQVVLLLETNLDDAPPEWLGYLMDALLAAGALDVVFVPAHMKKNRPGVQVQVLAHPNRKEALADILFQETTALGVRVDYCERLVLQRSQKVVESPWGPMRVMQVTERGGRSRVLPEFEACREVAREHRVALKDVYGWVASLNSRQDGF